MAGSSGKRIMSANMILRGPVGTLQQGRVRFTARLEQLGKLEEGGSQAVHE